MNNELTTIEIEVKVVSSGIDKDGKSFKVFETDSMIDFSKFEDK